MGYEMTGYDAYSLDALGKAKGLLDQSINTKFTYPQYVSSAQNAPAQTNYYNYTPSAPLAQIQSPNYTMSAGNYQGLMGGDYDKLQQALTVPGQQAAQSAYNQGYAKLSNAMGGQGLYGSSIMQNQANNGLNSVLQNALASNAAQAAAQRYGLQQQDLAALNSFNMSREGALNNYNLGSTQLQMGQAKNTNTAASNEANRYNTWQQNQYLTQKDYADQLNAWKNQQAYEKYLYDVTRQKEQGADLESKLNQALAVAGRAGTGVGAAQQALAAQQNAENNNWANYAKIGGGLLAEYGDDIIGAGGDLFGWLGDLIYGNFGG
jgi:hypothetical protein